MPNKVWGLNLKDIDFLSVTEECFSARLAELDGYSIGFFSIFMVLEQDRCHFFPACMRFYWAGYSDIPSFITGCEFESLLLFQKALCGSSSSEHESSAPFPRNFSERWSFLIVFWQSFYARYTYLKRRETHSSWLETWNSAGLVFVLSLMLLDQVSLHVTDSWLHLWGTTLVGFQFSSNVCQGRQ